MLVGETHTIDKREARQEVYNIRYNLHNENKLPEL